jgi:hypothetical protein
MPTSKWIDHVRAYSKANNISYSCAITEAKASYVKAPSKPRASRAPKPDKPMTKNYRKKVTPEQRERSKIVKQRILDRITY